MTRALVIGGTRFIGRHLVTELLDSGYEVTLLNRGNHENPFDEHPDVEQFRGDRTSGATLDQAAETVEPSVVVDCVAYYPGEVRMSTRAFSDVDAYVYISSGSAYGPDRIPKREDETPLEPCTDEQAVDDSHATYGARKAEGDRAVFEAAEAGVRAMSVRPTIVYGQYDYTGRFDYWVDRVRERDRVLVPGAPTSTTWSPSRTSPVPSDSSPRKGSRARRTTSATTRCSRSVVSSRQSRTRSTATWSL